MFEEFKGVLLYAMCKDPSPISRGPDDMVFSLVDCMVTLPESHYSSVVNDESSGRPPPSPDRVWCFMRLNKVQQELDVLEGKKRSKRYYTKISIEAF